MIKGDMKNTSFLSEHVQKLYNVVVNNEEQYNNCFNKILINWENVGQILGVNENKRFSYAERYRLSEQSLWGIINYGGKKLKQEYLCKEYKYHLYNSKWHYDCNIENVFDKFINTPDNSNVLLEAILKLTATLDRSLGNLVLLKEKEVPFLLRDLLLIEALQEVLGNVPVYFMQLLMGNVMGLNVRNVAWHGFFSKNEINSHLVAIIFLLIPSIGNILFSKGYVIEKLPRRPEVSITILSAQAGLLGPFNIDLNDYSSLFRKLVRRFLHIANGQQEFWLYAYELCINGCYGDAVIIILPIMEHMLRSVYCNVNKCPQNKLTAEICDFYVTLDVILEKNYESSENKLISLLGDQLLSMLLDLFRYQHGLRLRDKISHFEIDVNTLPKEIANHTITLCLCIVQHLLPETVAFDEKELEQIQNLITIQKRYEPVFHPTSLLKRQIHDLLNSIKTWSDLPRPPEFQHFKSMIDNENFKSIYSLVAILRNKKQFNTDEFLQELITDIKELKYPAIFRPSKEIELVCLFQRINTSIEEIHDNVTSNLTERYTLWYSRQMRSRQRDNYYRMLQYISIVEVIILCIVNLQINVIKQFSEIHDFHLLFFIKYFKIYLKYMENISSLSQVNKNRWEEIKNIIGKYCNTCIDMLNKYEK